MYVRGDLPFPVGIGLFAIDRIPVRRPCLDRTYIQETGGIENERWTRQSLDTVIS